MKRVKLAQPEPKSTLPLHEHNARRRRSKVVAEPGRKNDSRKAPHTPDAGVIANARLLNTYQQFAPQGPLHE